MLDANLQVKDQSDFESTFLSIDRSIIRQQTKRVKIQLKSSTI